MTRRTPHQTTWHGLAFVDHSVKAGEHVIVHPFASVGTQPFSYFVAADGWRTRKQCVAGVDIGAHVEVFSHANVDRGLERDTVIGTGTKIDHHVHVGHDSVIGERVVLCAGSIIGGFAEIGDRAYIGLNATIRNRVKVGAGAKIGMGANVTKNVPAGETWIGNPARRMET